jgi:hypothetical protein
LNIAFSLDGQINNHQLRPSIFLHIVFLT